MLFHCSRFAVGYAITNITLKDLYAILEKKKSISVYDMNIAGGDIMCLGITSVAYFCFVLLIEKLKTIRFFQQLFSKEKRFPYMEKQYDNDV